MRELLPCLPRPSRFAGIEDGACHKDASQCSLRIGLVFPDTYEVGMSYLGQKILYGIVNARESWWAERVMAPDREAGAILRAHASPLCTLESDTPLAQLHCLAFSITHELCYTNVLYVLDLAHIPLRTTQRDPDLRACPLVISGGGALLSAEPLAPFIDLMVLGDGEESLPEVLELLEYALAQGWTRSQLLEKARFIHGVYVPSLFDGKPGEELHAILPDTPRPARRIVADLDRAAYPTRQVVPVGAVHNRLSLEIARGCTRGCRFCHAGMVYRPVRERSLDGINALMGQCLRETGFDEISFLSLSTGDFSALKALCTTALDRCASEQISLSLPSLRVGSIDDEIIERMSELRRTGCTLAPEAGSQRLRDVINKGVSEEDLLLHAQKLLEHGWRQVKLYFMIGLPTEQDEDLEAIARLCRKVRDAAGPGGPRLQVTAALSPFVPKPFTPFQWEPQINLDEIERRVRFVRGFFKGQKCLKMRWHEPAMSHLEGILSRADRRMADVVERAYRKGAVFSSWIEGFELTPWLEALEESGLTAAEAISGYEPGAPLPWSHLEAGVSEEFLLRERRRAMEGKITEDCRYGTCRQCGVCDTAAGPSRLPHASPPVDGRTPVHCNRLIFKQRDQKAHEPRRDADGRLICKTQGNRPPQIAAALTHKAARYRIWHSKCAGSAWLSQLELQAVLERALRRAALPLAFSQGFHPLPLLSFGRALPVGVESQAEWFALTLHQMLPPAQLGTALAPMLPPGMRVLHVESMSTAKRVEQADFEAFTLRLPNIPHGDVQDCFADFCTQGSHIHTRDTKKGPRSADIRPLLYSWQATEKNTDSAVTFITDWRTLYISPITLCLAILAPLGQRELQTHLRLLKTAQYFAPPEAGQTLQ